MIRISRKHYSDRAFKKPLVLSRCRGALCLRLTFKRRTVLGDSYELEAFNPKMKPGKRMHAFYEVIEDRGGKWVLGRQLRITKGREPVKGLKARAAVPSAIHGEMLQLMTELDAAVLAETPAPPTKPEPPPKRGDWIPPHERGPQRAAFKAKKEAKVDRLKLRASTKRAEAEALQQSNRQMSSIMAGTPILVGHHSEKRHRRDLDRMHKKMGKAVALTKEAADLDRRARGVTTSTAISSDDPDAVEKLEAKALRLSEAADRMVALNKLLGRNRKGLDVKQLANARQKLEAAGVRADIIEGMLKPDFTGRYGFASYAITNTRSEARRVVKRAAELKKRLMEPTAPETYGEVRLVEEDNRLRVYFPRKPDAEQRKELKRTGFRWSPRAGAWQRKPSSMAWHHARHHAERWNTAEKAAKPAAPKTPPPRHFYAFEQVQYRVNREGRLEFWMTQNMSRDQKFIGTIQDQGTDGWRAIRDGVEHRAASRAAAEKKLEELYDKSGPPKSKPIRRSDKIRRTIDATPKKRTAKRKAPAKKKPARKGELKWGTTRHGSGHGDIAGIELVDATAGKRYMAQTPTSSAEFKTVRGAANYLDRRGYNADGTRKPPVKLEDWGVLVDARTGQRVRPARSPEVFDVWGRHAEKYDPTTGLSVALGAFTIRPGYPDAGRRVRLEAVPPDKEQRAIQNAWRRGWIAKKYKEKIKPGATRKARRATKPKPPAPKPAQKKKAPAVRIVGLNRSVMAIAANAFPESASFMVPAERQAVKKLDAAGLMKITASRRAGKDARGKIRSAEHMAKLTAKGKRALEEAQAPSAPTQAPAPKKRSPRGGAIKWSRQSAGNYYGIRQGSPTVPRLTFSIDKRMGMWRVFVGQGAVAPEKDIAATPRLKDAKAAAELYARQALALVPKPPPPSGTRRRARARRQQELFPKQLELFA